MGLRSLPFFKAKKGFQFAGGGFDSSGGGTYTLPPATASTLGGIIAGSDFNVTSDGALSLVNFKKVHGGRLPSDTYSVTLSDLIDEHEYLLVLVSMATGYSGIYLVGAFSPELVITPVKTVQGATVEFNSDVNTSLDITCEYGSYALYDMFAI